MQLLVLLRRYKADFMLPAILECRHGEKNFFQES